MELTAGAKECPLCNKLFKYPSLVRRHIFVAHKLTQLTASANQCPFCDNVYVFPSILRRHIKKVHRQEALSYNSEENCRSLNSNGCKVLNANKTNAVSSLATKDRPVSDTIEVENINAKTNEREDLELKKAKSVRSPAAESRPVSETNELENGNSLSSKEQMTSSKSDLMVGKECNICHRVFRTLFEVNQHILRIHKKESDGTEKKCKVCQKSFPDNYTLRRHILFDHREIFANECPFCDKAYLERYSLRRHILRVHAHERTDENSGESCNSLRSSRFKVSELNETNSVSSLATKGGPVSETDVVVENEIVLSKKMPFSKSQVCKECNICHKVFGESYGLNRHIRDVHKKKADATEKECKLCFKSFPDAYTLHRHMRIHYVRGKICMSQRFNSSKVLNVNKTNAVSSPSTESSPVSETMEVENENSKSIEEEELVLNETKSESRPVSKQIEVEKSNSTKDQIIVSESNFRKKCDICHKAFFGSYKLKLHIRRVHKSDGSTHNCKVCPRSFPDAYTLRRHILFDHRKVLAHECSFCDSAYLHSSSLRVHIKRVHKYKTSNDYLGENQRSMMSNSYEVSERNETYAVSSLVTESRSIPETDDGRNEICKNNDGEEDELNKTNTASYATTDSIRVSGTKEVENDNFSNEQTTSSKSSFGEECHICHRVIPNLYLLKLHIYMVHEKKADGTEKKCDVCLKSFHDAYTLRRHILLNHRKTSASECPLCDKAFLEVSTLRRHIKMVHKQKKVTDRSGGNRRSMSSNSCKVSEVNETNSVSSPTTEGRPVSERVEVEKGNAKTNEEDELELHEANSVSRPECETVEEENGEKRVKEVSFTCDCGKTHYSIKEYLLHLFMFHPGIYKVKRAELYPDIYS